MIDSNKNNTSDMGSAKAMDEEDVLGGFRALFAVQPDQIYLDGNSLGLLSQPSLDTLNRIVDEWQKLGIDGWLTASTPWFFLAETLAEQIAPLVGAFADEVAVANSTTVNLHQLLATLYEPNAERPTLLMDALSFPSDIYAAQSHLRLRGQDPAKHLKLVVSRDGSTLDTPDIIAAMTSDVQMVILPSVVYTSSQLLDMQGLTEQAHARGILIGFDCSHSVGAVPHALSAWGIDFAVWCHYKYLNGGPGAPGGLYLNRRHFGKSPGLAGWFSSDKEQQFDMSHTLAPAYGAGALQIGTPNVLSLAPLQGALTIVTDAGIERMRAKSLRLTAYLRTLVETELAAFGFSFATPQEDARRGGHLALVHPDATRICKALKDDGVIPDYRAPNIIRLAPMALYTSFEDCREAVYRLKRIMVERVYTRYATGRDVVA